MSVLTSLSANEIESVFTPDYIVLQYKKDQRNRVISCKFDGYLGLLKSKDREEQIVKVLAYLNYYELWMSKVINDKIGETVCISV